ncbi:beta-lactamase-like protein [Globomyces pollinis-pini]|nr:beta-lactamase-like protein [Globomyces pollinis-pini]
MAKPSEIIFFGTGTSGCVPNIFCLTEDNPSCKVCLSTLAPLPQEPGLAPIFSKNRRRNTSAMVRYLHSDGQTRNILIDAGKTFWASALTWCTNYKLRKLDAVILTHGHADAVMGLDDLRQWTSANVQDKVDVYCDASTLAVVSSAFPYMVDTKKATGSGEVAAVQFHLIERDENGDMIPFWLDELKVVPFEVEHGKALDKPYYALGYRFGDLTYISDTNSIPDRALDIIDGSSVLVIDALRLKEHSSHLSFEQAYNLCLKVLKAPARAFFTGFTHDLDHEEIEKWISEQPQVEGITIKGAYDGQRITL